MSRFHRMTLLAIPAALAAAQAFAAYPAWQEGNTYAAGTMVSYEGRDYRALATHTAYTGTNWNPAASPTLWVKIGASADTPAAPVVTPTATPAPAPQPTGAPNTGCFQAWGSDNVYVGGDQVTYNGRNYKAKWWTRGDNPTASGQWGVWQDLGACGGGDVTPTPVPPTPTPVVTPTPTPVVTPTPTPVVTPTPTPVVTPTPTPVVTPTPTPVVTPTPTPVVTPTPTPVVTPTPTPVVTPTPIVTPTPVGPVPTPVAGAQVGAYFAQWGIYGRNYQVKNIDTSGTAAKLTFINYAFGNVYQKNGGYECGMVNKLEPGATDPNAPGAGTGGDSWADYQKGMGSDAAIDGVGDTWGWPQWDDPRNGVSGPLKGNFNQLKKLKAKYPDLKVLISLGGWTWSKWFSAASATDPLRKQLVKSCIDLYIKGNLAAFDGSGGVAAANGVFDGIDIDWEFPGSHGGQPYNTVSPADTQNFTLLMKEFRTQLDALKSGYLLTAAVGAGKDKIDLTEPAEYSKYLDWINIMSYDYNGTWAAQGPTDFQSHLYPDPANPNAIDSKTGEASLATYYNTDSAVKSLLAKGVPAKKLQLGIPFYGRGWTGVQPGPNGDGLYQKASGAAKGTYEAGNEDYKVLKNAPGTVYYHPTTKQSWKYDGSNWWSYDTPQDIAVKIDYAKRNGLGGVFSWALDGDTANGELAKEIAKMRQ
ncbi:glycosyl hydrolase family 18 protein [Chitiniphilus eburneus]